MLQKVLFFGDFELWAIIYWIILGKQRFYDKFWKYQPGLISESG